MYVLIIVDILSHLARAVYTTRSVRTKTQDLLTKNTISFEQNVLNVLNFFAFTRSETVTRSVYWILYSPLSTGVIGIRVYL